jgi:hypothetical protein
MAYVLGVQRGGGPVYVWVGLTVGLTASAVLLVWRYYSVSSKRVQIGGAAKNA